MLELKPYQQRSLDELREFLANASTLKGERGIRLAYLDQLGDDAKHYKPIEGLAEAPFVCIKIPTGGGKTLVASHALKVVQDTHLPDKNGVGLVMWFVPSDAIRTQTLNTLRDRNHPYRAALDLEFNSNIKVFTVEEALSIQKADIRDNLCIVVASLAAFRRSDKTWLKVFQSNGSLLTHFETLVEETDFLDKDEDGEVLNSLANVIKINSPLVILDEGHNVQTELSFDMLRDLNPAAILEFTATPRSESNVLVQVLASELKAESMVKVPIYLTNVTQWQEAIRDGLAERTKLEKLALVEKTKTGEYIRPIALIQAEQEKESDSKIYVDQIKEFMLKELNIPEDQIAIKTAKQDQLEGVDLFSSKCPIRYILTVNALKEGWDCSFAYVLVSVANIGSRIAVEQTMGRILRLPQAQEKTQTDLNYSYVFTSSESFSKASSSIINGLEANGYSKDDLKENTGKIVPEKQDFDRAVRDADASIPVIGLKGTNDALAFNRDLLGADFKIYEHIPQVKVDFHQDQNRKVKIDIDEVNKIYKITQGKLSLIMHPEDFSVEELSGWLKRNVRHSAVSSDEMSQFIDLALGQLVKDHTIDELSINRFRLKEELQATVLKVVQDFAKSKFDSYLAKGELTDSVASYDLPSSTLIARPSDEHFQHHLFERAGNMNGEETEFAHRLDGLDNIAWWYRSREKEDFYLQGWKSGKFYPDFLVKLKTGAYLIVEYKGEDRLSNEDTAYKTKLGELWESLSGGKNKFFLTGKKDNEVVIKQIAVF